MRRRLPDIDWAQLLQQIRQQLGGRVPRCDVDDMTHDVAVTLLENFDRFDPSRSETSAGEFNGDKGLRAWVSGITSFKRIEYFAKKRREREVLEHFVQLADDRLKGGRLEQSSMEMGEALEPLLETLRECSPALLEVAGPYFEGKSPEAIGSELNLSESAVYQRLSRLRKRMKAKVNALRPRDAMPEVVFSPTRSLFDILHECVQEQTEPHRRRDGEHSQETFSRLVDGLTHLDKATRQQLKQAGEAIDDAEHHLSRDDKNYVSGQLTELAKQLHRNPPRRAVLKRLAKRIEAAAPHIFQRLPALQ